MKFLSLRMPATVAVRPRFFPLFFLLCCLASLTAPSAFAQTSIEPTAFVHNSSTHACYRIQSAKNGHYLRSNNQPKVTLNPLPERASVYCLEDVNGRYRIYDRATGHYWKRKPDSGADDQILLTGTRDTASLIARQACFYNGDNTRFGLSDPDDTGTPYIKVNHHNSFLIASVNQPCNANHATTPQGFIFHWVGMHVSPTITSEPITTVVSGYAYDYPVLASDADGHALTYQLAGQPQSLSIDSNTGVISGTPTEDEVADYAVTVTVTDSTGATAQQTFTLMVLPVLPSVTSMGTDFWFLFNQNYNGLFANPITYWVYVAAEATTTVTVEVPSADILQSHTAQAGQVLAVDLSEHYAVRQGAGIHIQLPNAALRCHFEGNDRNICR